MFLSNVTCIDHAYIDQDGYIIGGSFNPNITVSGKIDDVENVVVDFSTIKKDIKALIDDKETGFDHKLWIIYGVSNYSVRYSENMTHIYVTTPIFNVTLPINAVKFFNAASYADSSGLEDYLLYNLAQKYPITNLIVDYDTRMDSPVNINTELHTFRYTHGLKNSTSWGCQNIVHGHLSYLAGICNWDKQIEANALLQQIAVYLDKRMFVWKENAYFNEVKYSTPRGNFKLLSSPEIEFHKTVYMENETTIENIVEYIANKFKAELEKAGIHFLYISEGLNKGAVIAINPFVKENNA